MTSAASTMEDATAACDAALSELEEAASSLLSAASEIIAQSPSALQLRYLQVRIHLIIIARSHMVLRPRSAGLVLSVGRCESNSNSLAIAKQPAERN